MRQTVTQHYLRCFRWGSIQGILLAAYLLVACLALPLGVMADEVPEYEEISVFLNIQKVGGADIPAVIVDETVYLPVADIFTFLKIKNTQSAQMDSIDGFFINQSATYLIDKTRNRITFQDKVHDLKSNDLIKTESGLYLKSSYFGQIFGLDCAFNFRSLSVMMTTKLELPIIKEMRQAEMRTNINRLKGEVKADTIIDREFPMAQFGMADWSVNNTQLIGGRTDTRLNLDLGAVIAGGEANVRLNYSNNTPFDEKQQQYLWRFVNNDAPIVKQVMAGKIYSQMTSSVFNPIIGVQFTNTPTTYRRSFGTYTLSDITEPNWVVELYVNNVLVDYMKADASGFYKFEVPLVYGNSAVKLKFYGLWGEERVKEQNIIIPFNFLPPKELEYTLSAGIVEDTIGSRFSRANFNYGVSRRFTLGGGVEYLSSVITGRAMPFVSSSFRLFSGLLLTGEYTYGVRGKGMLSYRMPSNLQFEVNYTKYHPGQKAIIYNYLEERKATISIPVRGKNFSAYSRFTVNQIVLPSLKTTNAEMLWSGSIYGISTNFTTYGLFNDYTSPYLYSNLSLAFRMPGRFIITPQAQYDYNNKQLISVKTNFEKPLFKNGFLNMSYEQNFRSNTRSIEFGFRYDLAFAQTGLSFRNTNNQNTLIGNARGSLLHDRKTRYVGTNNRTSVGKGAISILPFLDVNGNGLHEKGEPKVDGLKFRINGGTIVQNEKDTIIRVLDLVPYTSYLLELDKNSFDNIAWQMHHTTMKVMIDPNQFKTIPVPISVMGEASGNVYVGSKGQGRILVCIYRNDTTLVARTLTESDGYFSYLGLKPGNYTVRIDPVQLKKINMSSTPEVREVTFSNSVDGDIIDGLDFNLSSGESTAPEASVSTSEVEPSSKESISPAGANLDQQAPQMDKSVKPVQEAVQDKPEVAGSAPNVESASVKNANSDVVEMHPQAATADQSVAPVHKEEKEPSVNNSPEPMIDKKVQFPGLVHKDMIIINHSGEILEAGSFKYKFNAFALRDKLTRLFHLPVMVVYMNLYYSVRIIGFSNRDAAMKEASKVTNSGFEMPYVSSARRNTSSIQLAEFTEEADALTLRKKLMERIPRNVHVVFDGNQYSVRIVGFPNQQAAVDFISANNL